MAGEDASFDDTGVEVLKDFLVANLSSSAAASVLNDEGNVLMFPNEAESSENKENTTEIRLQWVLLTDVGDWFFTVTY